MAKRKAADGLLGQLLNATKDADARANETELDFGLGFLDAFGYLVGDRLLDVKIGDVVKAIQMFQKFYGLKTNGVMDAETVRAMSIPRCGCADVEPVNTRVQKLKVLKAVWRKRNLKYYFESYVDGLAKDVQEDLEYLAWSDWMTYANIKVTQTKSASDADIIIGTGKGRRSQFDGPGNTLAWAYLPDGGDGQLVKRYDLEENWVAELSGQAREIKYRNVSCHESGHLLGLEHSTKAGALMAPYYSPALPGPVQNDDVTRIVKMYGAAVAPPKPAPAPPTPGTPGKKIITIEFEGTILGADIPGFRVAKFG